MVMISSVKVVLLRHLESLFDVKPQLYADNLKCSAERPGAFFDSARFSTGYVRLVGQEPAPSKCVFVSTSRVVRKDMKNWVLSQEARN